MNYENFKVPDILMCINPTHDPLKLGLFAQVFAVLAIHAQFIKRMT
jgi:hypothetical protein